VKFFLNATEIYNRMRNEFGEPLCDYISYADFVKMIKERRLKFKEGENGDFVILDLEPWWEEAE